MNPPTLRGDDSQEDKDALKQYEDSMSVKLYDFIILYIELLARKKPIVIVVDKLAYAIPHDWNLTRRLCSLVCSCAPFLGWPGKK